MITSILLDKSIHDRIIRYCIEKKPHEACGFLLGTLESAFIQVTEFLPVPNLAKDPSIHFTMDPVAMIPIVMNASASAYSIVGMLHSHPVAAAIPSAEDLQSAWYQIPSHWIVSLRQKRGYDIQVYRYEKASSHSHHASCDAVQYTPIPLTILQE